MIRPALVSVLLFLALACSTSGKPPAYEASPQLPSPESPNAAAPGAPMRVRWQLISDQGGRLVVEAVVERRAKLSFPVAVRIELPAGLDLVSGPSAFIISPDQEPGQSSQRFEFTYSGAPPAGDLKLVGTAEGKGIGINASAVYRFGRTSEPARPTPSGPSIKFGDKDLGPAIPIK